MGSNSININFPDQVMNRPMNKTKCPKIQELESFILPMPEGRDEVKAAMDPVVYNVAPVQTTLIMKVSFKLVVNVLDNCFEAVVWGEEERGILN